MKNTIIILLILSIPLTAFSQSEELAELDKEKASYEKQISDLKGSMNSENERVKRDQDKIDVKKSELTKLDDYEQNFSSSRILALSEISENLKSLSVFQKLGSKASFYKCLRTSLEQQNKLAYDSCYNSTQPKLSDEEKAQGANWKITTGLSFNEIKSRRESLPHEIKILEGALVTSKANAKYWEAREEVLNFSLKAIDIKKKELSLIPANAVFNNCDANTPEINLEEKVPYVGATFSGAFHGVPRDNQDGLGTCYANAAKNLLVGVSGGKDVASFLDVALAYKEAQGGLDISGLDAGLSCMALAALKKKGYCPQQFAPMETGERNHAGESLFNTDATTYLATNVTILREFLGGLSNFEKSSDLVKEDVLKRSEEIVQRLKNDSSIHLPLPIIRRDIPTDWKINETYHTKKATLLPLTEKEFAAEYKKSYKVFYPIYIKAVLEGKSLDQVFELYKTAMDPFFTKYNLQSVLPEYKRIYKMDAEKDYKDPQLSKKLRASIDFLKDIMNKKNDSDDEFIAFCSNSGNESMKFLGALQPLIEKLRQDKLNEENLFDKDGKFRSAQELMQLTVAPACLNPENRKKMPEFSCHDGYDTIHKIKGSNKTHEQKIRMMREKVVLSLVQGYPLGNSYPTSPSSGHINTIVGIRFNKQSGSCEYRIRESQTGTSSWLLESPIFEKINALTEVRKDK